MTWRLKTVELRVIDEGGEFDVCFPVYVVGKAKDSFGG